MKEFDQVTTGERPTEARLKQALIEFNDKEWKIDRALETPEYDTLKEGTGLSLNALMALAMLREGKSQLRWTVQQEVNFYGQDGVWPSKARVRKLIQAIQNLNVEIEQIEAIINRRASAGPHLQTLPKRTRPRRKASSKTATISRRKTSKQENVE